MPGMDKVVTKTVSTIDDPFMWFCILIIGALIYLIWWILKNIVGKSIAEIFEGQKEATSHIAEYNRTLSSVLEMVRVAVIGPQGRGL